MSYSKRNTPFYSKIMLFGEYSIICGSMALTIPYSHFNGSLSFINNNKYTDLNFARRSNHQLREYYNNYLKPIVERGELLSKFNYQLFKQDIDNGLYFESSIPEGYGLGSSGALVAALYERYNAQDIPPVQLSSPSSTIASLKKELATLESWFHGTSSGIDPLICYFQHALLIKKDQLVQPVGIPRYNLSSDDAIFLINSGKSVKTAPLVDQFINDCENPQFRDKIINQYIPLNNGCIQSLIDGNIIDFEKQLHALSLFQVNFFKPMIPSAFTEMWTEGIESRKYLLKLCGSGGGGFILGFTHHYKEVEQNFRDKGIEMIPVYQH